MSTAAAWRISAPHNPILLVLATLALLLPSGGAQAASVVDTLLGSWGGSGRITYTDGSSEGIRCTAYYTGGGSNLRMAIQCRSERNPIHIRSQLQISGGRVSGQWEERTFNASGAASGSVGAGHMSLAVTGGGFAGSMAVRFSKSSQSITITIEGVAVRRITMSLRRR